MRIRFSTSDNPNDSVTEAGIDDLSVVRHISDRIAIMYLGKIVELGPSAVITTAPRHAYTKALLSAIPVPDPTVRRQRHAVSSWPRAGGNGAFITVAQGLVCPAAGAPKAPSRAVGPRCHR